jgi:RNA polymerase sigma-70 factor (ECF subfamily)
VVTRQTFEDGDAADVAACQHGDVNRFECLVQRYHKRMFGIAYRMTGNREDAEEIVQDAFMAAYRNIGKFRGDAKFSTWLTTIVLNRCKNRLNKVRRERVGKKNLMDTEKAQKRNSADCGAISSSQSNPLRKVMYLELAYHAQQCIDRLKGHYREAMVLSLMGGGDYQEIADIMNVAKGTVKSRVYRARDQIRACLKTIYGDLSHVLP